MPYDAATIEDARRLRMQAWIDRLNGVISQVELYAALGNLRTEWGAALYSR